MTQPSETRRYQVLLGLVVALCLGGVLAAAFVTQNRADGGRGGVLAVAVSFAALFLGRSYGTKVYDIIASEAATLSATLRKIDGRPDPAPAPATSDAERVNGLAAKIKTDAAAQTLQNKYLAAASVLGTLTAGFGDVAAGWLM